MNTDSEMLRNDERCIVCWCRAALCGAGRVCRITLVGGSIVTTIVHGSAWSSIPSAAETAGWHYNDRIRTGTKAHQQSLVPQPSRSSTGAWKEAADLQAVYVRWGGGCCASEDGHPYSYAASDMTAHYIYVYCLCISPALGVTYVYRHTLQQGQYL